MKTPIAYLTVLAVILMSLAGVSYADQCQKAEEMIDWGILKTPGAMNEEMFQTALMKCPENADLYCKIARYYKEWWEKELKPELQAEYRQKAIDNYRQAIDLSRGKNAKALKAELAALNSGEGFSILTMRRLRPSKQGATGTGVTIKVFFELNSYQLTNAAQEHLDILGEYLKENKKAHISLEGHTDLRGEKDFNKELSLKRSEAAKNYLVKNFGIDDERVLTCGHGYERLAVPTNPYDSQNRRVEVIKLSE